MTHFPPIPIIDIAPLLSGTSGQQAVAEEIGLACRRAGFFYIVGHGVAEQLQLRLDQCSREFFAQDLETKLEIDMTKGGKTWRGYFPVGRELTSGRADLKEGIYFGKELSADHPLVKAGTPMHGPNLFPSNIPGLRDAVLDYMEAMTGLGHGLMRGVALSLGLNESYFQDRYTSDPLILFRIFNYPAGRSNADGEENWGVGEHTDYGVLTILRQDGSGGLEVKSRAGWTEAPPIPGSFVCNIGDMLDRMTGGLYRSTPHRVKSPSSRDRLSFPFFFDPNFNAEVQPIEISRPVDDDSEQRWDRASVHTFKGTYGDYLLSKVSRVFPELHREVV